MDNDLTECEGIVGMEANTYTLVQEKVDVLIRLRDKYLPNDAEDELKKIECETEWDKHERIENETKWKYYVDRSITP